MAKKQLYNTLNKSRVQTAHEFFVAKEIEHDECEIFKFFSVIQQSKYQMIEPWVFSRPYTNSSTLKICGRMKKSQKSR